MGDYSWPGNLREMRNLLERTAVLTSRETIDPEPPSGFEQRPSTLAETEREQILKALAYTRGHQGRAAEVLGISRKALWEKRRRHGLP
jgi:two-component system NtrC family response regulator